MSSDSVALKAPSGDRDPSRPVGLVLTGGTIGSEFGSDRVVRLPTGKASGRLIEAIEKWATNSGQGLAVQVSRPLNKLSENMVPADWVTIADDIQRLANSGIDRFLVLHGTDTAAQATAALSFLCAHLPVTICLTGSNLPPNQDGSDAAVNVTGSLTALLELPPGVYLSFSGIVGKSTLVHLGTRVRKTMASGRAFVSVNRDLVAEVTPDLHMRHVEPHARAIAQARGPLTLDARVLLMRQFPGLDWGLLDGALRSERCRGVVIELYPSMTGPVGTEGRTDLTDFVRRARASGVFVGLTVSCAPDGFLNWYESAVDLRKAGAVILGDMLPEVAAIKLMWLFGDDHVDADDLAELMLTPVAEEIRRVSHPAG